MKDRDFLCWIHERFTEVHGDDPQLDWMYKLRAIIVAIPKDKDTPNSGLASRLEDLSLD